MRNEFIGKAAALSMKQRGPRLTLVTMSVDNTDSDCMGNEPVYHQGNRVGVTTSGAYGHATNLSLAFAYVEPQLAVVGTEFEVMIFGQMRQSRIIADSIWDPGNERLKA